MVRNNNEYIVGQLLAMNEEERVKFLDKLTPDALRYLDIVLEKAGIGDNTNKLKRFLDNHDG